MIQKSLRTELGSDVTLLTVAHRLQTIMDSDKIVSQSFPTYHASLTLIIQLVLDAGRIVSIQNMSELALIADLSLGRIRHAEQSVEEGRGFAEVVGGRERRQGDVVCNGGGEES